MKKRSVGVVLAVLTVSQAGYSQEIKKTGEQSKPFMCPYAAKMESIHADAKLRKLTVPATIQQSVPASQDEATARGANG